MSTSTPSQQSSSHKIAAESNRPLIERRGIAWHKTAPASLRRIGREANGAGWDKWQSHLLQRKKPHQIGRLLPDGAGSLLWAFADEESRIGLIIRLIDAKHHDAKRHAKANPLLVSSNKPTTVARQVAEWLDRSDHAQLDTVAALEHLAWCHALPSLARRLDADLWWRLLQRLVDTADEALSADFSEQLSRDQLLVEQLAAGELPLTLAYLFPELKPCRRLRRAAKKVLSSGIIEWTDGEGMPSWKTLAQLRPLMACWTRCCALGEAEGSDCWTSEAQNQYDWMLRQAMRLTRPDGSQPLVESPEGDWSADLFAAAVEFGADDADRHIAHLVWPSARLRPAKPTGGRSLPDAAEHSEWAELAAMRSGWKRTSPTLHVSYGGDALAVVLSTGRQTLLDGVVETTIKADEEPLEFTSGWTEVCWVSDEDIVYLELETSLSGGFSLHRHLALAREDNLLLIADALVGDPAQISDTTSLYHQLSLPMATDFRYAPEDETREGYLYSGRKRYLVQPLALPEWRVDPRRGSLAAVDGTLRLTHETVGRTMFTPLLVDLDSRRGFTASTWRQLTVALDLKIQPPTTAAGYRCQIGKKNWLVYRSLAKPAPRTVMGHHLNTEFLFARFGKDGNVKPLIEVE